MGIIETQGIEAAPVATGRLAGKTAVITGGTSGLGLETARHFLAEGARVIVTGSQQSKLDAALSELGDRAKGHVADVRDPAALRSLARTVRDESGEIDILFANAGLGRFAPIETIDEAFYDEQFDTNVKGVFFTVQSFLPLLRTGASVILNASAVHGRGVATGSVYFATKAAVRSLARTLGAELAPRGIRVNALSPGLVLTGFQARSGMSAEQLDGFGQFVTQTAPLGRLGQPEEIAKAAVFLASDDSSYMTGADLTVDGGFMNV